MGNAMSLNEPEPHQEALSWPPTAIESEQKQEERSKKRKRRKSKALMKGANEKALMSNEQQPVAARGEEEEEQQSAAAAAAAASCRRRRSDVRRDESAALPAAAILSPHQQHKHENKETITTMDNNNAHPHAKHANFILSSPPNNHLHIQNVNPKMRNTRRNQRAIVTAVSRGSAATCRLAIPTTATTKNHHHHHQRSLSSSSSLGSSSASSSPSSSSMQIYPQKRHLYHHQAHQYHNQNSNKQGNKKLQHHHHILSNSPPSSSSSTSTSSASSTISSCSQDSNCYDLVGSLLSSTANLSLQPDLWFQQQQKRRHEQQIYLNPPPPRPWQQVAGDWLTNEPSSDFTVLSYNVLCDRMVNSDIFPASSDLALDWHYRRQLILNQLLEFAPDVIALQELELEQFETYFKPQLSQLANYESIFEPKSRARTMDQLKRSRVDGCAIFFKANRFRLIQHHLLEFNQIAMANAQGSEAMLNRVMTKDNIGLVAVLEFVEPFEQVVGLGKVLSERPNGLVRQKRHILVCNTHIHWDPEFCDVKLIQTIMLMNELQCIAHHHKQQQQQQLQQQLQLMDNDPSITPNSYLYNTYLNRQQDDLMPLVLLGDFNSLPNSGVTSFLTAGKINSSHKDFKSYKYTSCSNALSIRKQSINISSSNQLSVGPNQLAEPARRQSSPAWCYRSPTLMPDNTTQSLRDILKPPILTYNHPFRLASAYEKDTMPYTNFTTNFKATIDYIFYSRNSLQLLGRLGPLDKLWLKGNRIKGLPQPHLPSDHLPLFVKLRLTSGGDANSMNCYTTNNNHNHNKNRSPLQITLSPDHSQANRNQLRKRQSVGVNSLINNKNNNTIIKQNCS